MPADLPPEYRRLYLLLRDHPNGLGEYDLLERLRGTNPLRGLNELETFRVHFLLFHQLHHLRRELESQRRGSLEIHCLLIRLQPLAGHQPNPGELPLAPDPVAHYYLDAENLAETDHDDVKELLRWFWKRFQVHGRKEDALEELDLGPCATPEEIRRRFREMARAHHPDLGGDTERFHRLVDAMEVLRVHDSLPTARF